MTTASQIREAFLRYFEERGHRRVRSSSLVPEKDPTLLFTNAGMNQFKDVFLGLEKRDYKRAATSQKCMRVSGKHNDLETVGRTPRHHTFFEMLGNFSFGDYFKKEAIAYAWELCVEVYGLPAERLNITVFHEDDDALGIWKKQIGIPDSRIFKLGEKDNFWAMGETGPCGPCSELHFDMGTSPVGHTDCTPECSCGRFVEIWNLVFMQFNRDASGTMHPLPTPSIDTGMGLERISCMLQGVQSNYDTDLFVPIIREAARLTGAPYGESETQDVSLRILADHSRACAFLVNSGVAPGNEGRGYVLRKIMRRAIRHGKMLGKSEPFLFTLTALVCDLMKDAYPELVESREYASNIVLNEEERFSATLNHGLQRLEEVFEQLGRKGETRVAGADLFRLYDTYGFPLDLAREICGEKGFQTDEEGFYAEMEKQRERARASWKGVEKSVSPVYAKLAEQGYQTEFTGYERIQGVDGKILALVRDEQPVDSLRQGESGLALLDRSPFYAEAGGQVGDTGALASEAADARVLDTFSPISGIRLHSVEVLRGILSKGDSVRSSVAPEERRRTARNHTATHLLHAALREVLGEHVKQAGSLVAPGRLRFDFTHYRPLSARELRRIEEMVNQKIRENIAVQTEVKGLEEAVQQGAMALFGEKYQERVRVVQIPGFSMELCGGTHVSRTGDISLFKIVHESSISAGVRRVEAITGDAALERFLENQRLLDNLSERLRVPTENLEPALSKLAQDLKETQKELEKTQLQLAGRQAGDALGQARDVNGVKVLAQRVENLDSTGMRALADQLRAKLKSGVVVLGVANGGKVSLIAMVTPDLTDKIQANQLIKGIARLVEGGGGGRPDMAEAGGKNPAGLAQALEQAYAAVAELTA